MDLQNLLFEIWPPYMEVFVRRGWGLILHTKNGSCTINAVTWPKFRACAMLKYGNFHEKKWIKILVKLKKGWFVTKTVTQHHNNLVKNEPNPVLQSSNFLRIYKNGWFLVKMVTSGLLGTNKPTDLIICDMASILGGVCRKWLRFDFAYTKWIMPN